MANPVRLSHRVSRMLGELINSVIRDGQSLMEGVAELEELRVSALEAKPRVKLIGLIMTS